jgi:hypothetical protein
MLNISVTILHSVVHNFFIAMHSLISAWLLIKIYRLLEKCLGKSKYHLKYTFLSKNRTKQHIGIAIVKYLCFIKEYNTIKLGKWTIFCFSAFFHKAACKALAHYLDSWFVCMYLHNINVCVEFLKSFTASQCLAYALFWNTTVNAVLLPGALPPRACPVARIYTVHSKTEQIFLTLTQHIDSWHFVCSHS